MTQQHILPLSKDLLRKWVYQFVNQSQRPAVILDANNTDLTFIHCNESFTNLFGYSQTQIVGQAIQMLNGFKTKSESYDQLVNQLLEKDAFQQKIIHYKADLTAFWNEITCHPIKDEQNEVQFLVLFFKDVTISSIARMISRLEREVYEHFENDYELEAICNLIASKIEEHYIQDMYCTIQLKQGDHLELFGHGQLPYRAAQKLCLHQQKHADKYIKETIHIEKCNANPLFFKQYLEKDLEIDICTKWIKPMYSRTNRFRGFITFYFERDAKLTDIDSYFLERIVPVIILVNKFGEQKKELQRLAYYDTNTNIPNAHYFRMKLQEWKDAGKQGLVILAQPGEYSMVVDLYGRSIGDELLKQMVERFNLHNNNNQEEFIARFSNSLIIATCVDHDDLANFDMRTRPLTLIPYFLKEKETYITLKIGASYFGADLTVEDSIRQADLALSKARQESGTNVVFFESTIDEKLQYEMDTLNQLIYGLQNDEFTIHLQPKMNIKTGRIDGFEALSRWHSKVLGNVAPNVFIPLAEQAGHIKEIDTIVLRKVLDWLQNRIKLNKNIVPVAVNISPDHFYDVNFTEHILALVHEYDVPLKYIKLELTESIELVDFNRAKEILNRLKEIGIDCSIDDFGVGYSSLSYLPKLPFSEIKIDRSFISAMDDVGMYAVIQTIIQLASNLQMKAVAEGIETMEQYVMLKKMGCHTGQGFFLHKPMTIDVASALLDSSS